MYVNLISLQSWLQPSTLESCDTVTRQNASLSQTSLMEGIIKMQIIFFPLHAVAKILGFQI